MEEPRLPRVLCVTGAYAPEFSAGGLQCQAVAARLHGQVQTRVVTTATSPRSVTRDVVDGVPVWRVRISGSAISRLIALWRLLRALAQEARRADLVHIQGYSSKNILVAIVARWLRRPVVLHLQTSRHDEPAAIRAQGSLAWWAFRSADRYIGVSPGLIAAAIDGGIPAERIVEVPNGVDLERFAPVTDDERRGRRIALGIPADRPVVLFVGVISPDKQPDVLLQAWRAMEEATNLGSTLVFVGATNPALFELGDRLADRMRAVIAGWAATDRVIFAEPTRTIEHYYQAADVLVMPSLREGLPNVVLEAMSSGLPVVASRLAGSTDRMIRDGVDGWLVSAGDVAGFAEAVKKVLTDRPAAAAMGRAARSTAVARYDLSLIAQQWLAIYQDVLAA